MLQYYSIIIDGIFNNILQIYLSFSSDQCTGMMVENYLSTDATYPITYGTAITVACDPEYELLGSEVITCEKGIVYSHKSVRPKCVNAGN